ncbi:Hsp20/alpha crystallin family protein [Metabacillus sp. SLBN-84]
MDIHKVQKWLEFTNANQKNDFWQNIFDQQKPERLFEENHKPLYDLYKSDTHVCAVIELPGVGRDDVTFALKSNIDLIVKGHKRALYPQEMEVEKHRAYGDFEWVIRLPEPAHASQISLHFDHGLVYAAYPVSRAEPIQPIEGHNNLT